MLETATKNHPEPGFWQILKRVFERGNSNSKGNQKGNQKDKLPLGMVNKASIKTWCFKVLLWIRGLCYEQVDWAGLMGFTPKFSCFLSAKLQKALNDMSDFLPFYSKGGGGKIMKNCTISFG